MEQILNNIQNKNNKINSFIQKTKELNNHNVELLYNIFQNINDVFNSIENYYYLMLDKEDIYKTIEKEKRIKEIKINEQINKALIPYMLMMKMKLDDTI